VAQDLTGDPDFAATTYVVIDFETTTPAGYRPEPIEVAALALQARGGRLVEVLRWQALMRPPTHAPVNAFDASQTGITPQMVASRPLAAVILAELDALLDAPPYRLVAHHAPTEGGILYDYRACCPRLAATALLDTVRLARVVFPDLPSHSLDVLLDHVGIGWPAGRHRAMPDVEVTAELFRRLIDTGSSAGLWRCLADLTTAAGIKAKAAQPCQDALF
jgi:DNA polymerase-3 subunit epsilon